MHIPVWRRPSALFSSALGATLVLSASAWAQVNIIYPQEGQDVRGEVTARFEGIPAGGYAVVRVDGQFKQATAQEFIVLDTLADRTTFGRGDGNYKLEVTVRSRGGGQVGTATVNFNVANQKVAEGAEGVRLAHWVPSDILEQGVTRYRVFAESNATISEDSTLGGGAAAGGGGEGGGDSGVTYIPAPLDYQVTALMRRMMRNYPMYDNSANIVTVVQDGFERQRLSEAGGGGEVAAAPTSRRRGAPVSTAPVKAPWNDDWNLAPENGERFVKMIRQDGTEINATRKAPAIALADLLPTFPNAEVRPGSTWETSMTILGDLSSRKGVNVIAPVTFTSYENIVTPGGESRRAAKLESRFRLPENTAKRIAANLANKVGTGAAGGEAGGAVGGLNPAGGEGGEMADQILPEDIEVARTDVARVIWFDMDRRRVLRAEDSVNSVFEIPVLETAGAEGAAPAGAEGEAAAPAEPTRVSYRLNVTTAFDDRVPPVSETFTGGAGTAHSADSVPDLSLVPLRAVTNR